MFSISSLLFAVTALLPGAVVARAADFCADPYTAVCGTAKEAEQARRDNIDRFRIRVADGAAAKKAGECDGHESPFAALKKSYERISGVSNLAVADLENSAALKNIETVRGLVKAAIDEQQASGSLTAVAAAAMKARVDRVEIRTPAMLMKHGFSLNMISYHLTCGLDGMENNAYAVPGDDPYILLCPGWLAAAEGAGQNPESNFLNVIQVISHELGHHIDAGTFPALFAPYAACLARTSGSRLHYGKEGWDLLVSEMPKALEPATRYYRVYKHEREITADFWAAHAVRQYLKTLTAEKRLPAVQQAWSGLCSGDDEGIHPTGRYRIEVLLRGDPGIGALMGCPVARQASCDLGS